MMGTDVKYCTEAPLKEAKDSRVVREKKMKGSICFNHMIHIIMQINLCYCSLVTSTTVVLWVYLLFFDNFSSIFLFTGGFI